MLSHVSLFTGIAGIDIAAEWSGFETICFVEKDKYCQKVLKKHWPNIPIIEDVKDVTKERIQEIMADTESRQSGEQETGNRREDISRGSEALADSRCQYDEGQLLKRQYEEAIREGTTATLKRPNSTPRNSGITLISGGFPCQPHSVAGKREGSADERNLWPEFRRVIGEIKPRWVLAENVPGLFSSDAGRFFGTILADLAEMGYSTGWATYGAVDVGALHRRNRVFIVAYSGCFNSNGGSSERRGQEGSGTRHRVTRPSEYSGDVANAKCEPSGHGQRGGCEIFRSGQAEGDLSRRWSVERRLGGMVDGFSYWLHEPDGIPRVIKGQKNRVDRLKCLGNAVVPQQIYPVLKEIADIEVDKRLQIVLK